MSIKYKEKLPEDFPEKFLLCAKPLQHLGISEITWNREDAIKVIEFLYNCDYAILGGDVYKIEDGSLESTYDSWYFNRNEANSSQEFIQLSRNSAITYINQYHNRNGSDYYYSIVFKAVK